MNVFWHELKARRKSTIIWGVVMVVFMIMCMAKYDAITAGGGAAIQKLLSAFPSTVQAIFGMNGLDLTTVGGYYGVCFLFVAIILAVHGGITGTGVISEEEESNTTEFLYTKPQRRSRIVFSKIMAGLLLCCVVWGSMVVGSVIGIKQFAKFGDFGHDFALFIGAGLAIHIVFFSIGVFSVLLTRGKSGQGRLVMIFVFASYLLYVFSKLSPQASWLHFFSIFRWYDASDILAHHHLILPYLLLSAALAICAIALACLLYGKRDLHT